MTTTPTSNPFDKEQVLSGCDYPLDYKIKNIADQTNLLRELIPSAGFANEKLVEQPLMANAEGYFAILRWQKIAPSYGKALKKILNLIKETRGGMAYDRHKIKFGSRHLRQHAKNIKAFNKLGKEQEGYDVLVVPCQFGKLHRGKSVRNAREAMNSCEFPLDPFAVACMLLTHPQRLQRYDDLWIDCSGGEYSAKDITPWENVLCFYFDGEKFEFSTVWFGRANVDDGSASAFLT